MGMKFPVNKVLWGAVAGALLLAACSRDPVQQRLKYLSSGQKYFEAERYQEASIEFRNAAQADPKSAEARYQLARAYLKLSNPRGAYQELKQAQRLAPADMRIDLELAGLLIASRQYDEAQTIARKILATDPNNAQAHVILGQKYAMTQDFPNAILEIRKAIELNPGRVENYTALAALLLSSGKPEEAEAAVKKAVEANPKSPLAHLTLGQYFFTQRKMAEAEAEMRAAADLDAHAVMPRLLLARIYAATGRVAEAEKLYTDLKTAAPEDPRAYQALGLYYASTGQKEKALAEFQSLAAAKPKDNQVKVLLIGTLIGLNRMEEAAKLDQEMLKADPTNVQALVLNGRILIAGGNTRTRSRRFRRRSRRSPILRKRIICWVWRRIRWAVRMPRRPLSPGRLSWLPG